MNPTPTFRHRVPIPPPPFPLLSHGLGPHGRDTLLREALLPLTAEVGARLRSFQDLAAGRVAPGRAPGGGEREGKGGGGRGPNQHSPPAPPQAWGDRGEGAL